MSSVNHPIIESVQTSGNNYPGMVEGQFTAANQWANSSIDQTQTLLGSLSSLVEGIEVPASPDLTLNLPNVPEFAPGDAPTFETTLETDKAPAWDLNLEAIPDVEYNAPGNPPGFAGLSEVPTPKMPNIPEASTAPDLDAVGVDIPDTDVGEAPSFTNNIPERPAIESITRPSDDISLGSIPIPDVPELSLPDAPSLSDIVVPDPPAVTLPPFEAKTPDLETFPEISSLEYKEDVYVSGLQNVLLPRFIAAIEGDPTGKGTGIPKEIEEQIYQRGRIREQEENERFSKEVDDQFSALGFSLPTGAYASRKMEVSHIIDKKNEQLSREIMVNQAELEQKNIHHVIEQAGILEGRLMEFFNQTQTRNLEAARATVQSSIDVANAMIEQQKAKLAVYQTEASVFESKIRSELAKTEIYKAQVEGSKVAASVQTARIEMYTAKIGALSTTAELYKTQMDSAKIQAEIENAKIDAYKARVEAYSATVGAEQIKVEMYNSEVNAERTRALAYGERVKGFQAKVQAKTAEVELKTAEAEIKLKNNQQKMEGFKADIEAFKARIEGVKAEADIGRLETEAVINQNNAKAQVFGAETDAYRAQVEGARAETEGKKAAVEGKITANRAKIEQSKAESDAFVSITNAKTQQYIGQVEAYKSQIAAFTAEMEGKTKQFDASIEAYKTEASSAETQMRVALGHFEATSNSVLAAKEIATNAAGHAATVSSNLAAGAMNSVNASAGVSASFRRAESETGHDSISENHTFHHTEE